MENQIGKLHLVKKWIGLAFLVQFIFLFSTHSRAQTLVNELDEKFKLEKSISERLEQTLKTRLDKNFFDITVEVKLKIRPVGFSAHRMEEMRHSENFKSLYVSELNQAVRQNSRPYELEALKITLGLSDQIDQKYRESLKAWLTDWANSMFGKIAEAQIIIRPSNVTLTKNSPFQGGFWEALNSSLARYQNFLGMIFLGLVILFMRYFPANKKSAVNAIEPVPQVVALPLSEVAASEPMLVSSDDSNKRNNLLSLKKKIAWLSSGMVSHTENLISLWMERDAKSHLKIAAWLEALAEGSSGAAENYRAPIPTLPPAVHALLPKTLAALNEMDLGSQYNLFQEVYSDILAGEYQEKEPRYQDFEFLQRWPESDLIQAFNHLERSSQVTFLSRLPKAVRKKLSASLDQNLLRDVLTSSLQQEPATDEQLLKDLLAWDEVHHPKPRKASPDFVYNIIKLRDAWSALPPLEEALWLYQAVLNYPELKEKLSHCKDNVAFLGDLAPEQLRKICMMTKTRELAAVIKLLPFLRSPILGVCGEMMKRDVLNEEVILVEPALTQNFNKFVDAYQKTIRDENFELKESIDEKQKSVA